METLCLNALSARTISVCFAPKGALYHLPELSDWRITGGGVSLTGRTDRVVTVIDGLEPATDYNLTIGGRHLAFRTLPCTGLVSIVDHGAIADGPDTAAHAAENARAFTRAIAATPKGGSVLVPEGRWITGPVALRSDLTVVLRGTLAAPSDRSGWPVLPAFSHSGRMLGSWEGLPADCFAAPLYAVGAERLTIAGPGCLDGGGDRGDWWTWPKETRDGARRPRGLHLIDCNTVQLTGFTIRNAPSWTIHPQGCCGLTVTGLHIIAPHDSPNTDGCNPEMSRNVRIEGVRFSVGDDCIAIKSGKRDADGGAQHLRPTRDITIRHCLMERGHGGVVIGSEMSGDVIGVMVSDCLMDGTDRGLRIKTRRGRGGLVDNVTFANVTMKDVQTAFSANAFYHCDADGHDEAVQTRTPAPVTDRTPTIGRITVRDIDIYGLSHAIGAFIGLPEAPIGPISLRGVTVHSLDDRAVATPPVMADHIRPLRHAGVVHEFARIDAAPDLTIDDGGLTRLPERIHDA